MTPEELKQKALILFSAHGWQTELAKDTGHSKQTVSSWYNERHKIPKIVEKYLDMKIRIEKLVIEQATFEHEEVQNED